MSGPPPVDIPSTPSSVARHQDRAAQAELMRRIWMMRFRQAMSITEIALELGLSEGRVKKWVRRQEAAVRERFMDEAEAVKAETASWFEYVRNDLMEEWERSKLDTVTITTGNAMLNQRTGEVTMLPDQVITKSGAGSPALVNAAMEAEKQKLKVYGLDAPDKKEISFAEDGAHDSLRKKLQDLASRTAGEYANNIDVVVEELSPQDELERAKEERRQIAAGRPPKSLLTPEVCAATAKGMSLTDLDDDT